MDAKVTTDGEIMFDFVDPEIYEDDPIGKNLQEECLGMFRRTAHGTYVLELFWDADSLAEALGVAD